MPMYPYRCPRCGEFEVEQRITESALTTCPNSVTETVQTPTGGGFRVYTCGEPVERLIAGSTTFTLKGPRWAKDGY